ncbi:MAG: hypothetical protein R2724_27840 [Bryobacterales bacterium]
MQHAERERIDRTDAIGPLDEARVAAGRAAFFLWVRLRTRIFLLCSGLLKADGQRFGQILAGKVDVDGSADCLAGFIGRHQNLQVDDDGDARNKVERPGWQAG